MALDEPKENEQLVEVNGIGLLIDELVKPILDGATVDYVQNMYGEGFTIEGLGATC